MKIPLCFMALSCVHEWPCFTGLSFCFMAWHMCQMFLTHAGVSDPASYSDDLDKKKGYLCVWVQQQRLSVEKGVKRCGLAFKGPGLLAQNLTQPCGYIGDVEMRGERNYLPGLCCESDHKEGSWRPEWRNKAHVEISGPSKGFSNEPQ